MEQSRLAWKAELGELIEGSFADLLLLKSNPLEDVASLDRTRENLMLVITDGRIVKSQVDGLTAERACDGNQCIA